MWFFSEEQYALKEMAEHFAKINLMPHAIECDVHGDLPPNFFSKLSEQGFLTLILPLEEGGLGYGAIETTLVMQAFAFADAAASLSYLAHTILCLHQIATHGTPVQKQKFIPLLTQGQWVGCMAMSEPNAGSDALAIQTQAIQTQGNYYLLHGTKTWVTNGPIANLIYCYARTGPEKKQITPFLVEKSFQGVHVGKKFIKMGMRGSPTGEIFFDQTMVPVSHQIGVLHEGVPCMMKNLDLERITISGISLGLAKRALEIATQYAKERFTFGRPIGAYQQIQERLAENTAWYEACHSLTYQAAAAWDKKAVSTQKLNTIASAAKLQSAQMATKVCLDAVQILGGYGYTQEFTVERLARDAKLIEIGAGTNEILRIVIARNLLGHDIVKTY